jgi:ubiquinone/menaquinone biosynthesis C-methylase UbiE
MDHFQQIYTSQAWAYHRMIQAEDADGNLLKCLNEIAAPQGRRLLDLGTGTGRIPLLLAGLPSLIVGLDLHRAMLKVNCEERAAVRGDWHLAQGDFGMLPFPGASFDVLTAGWAIGHLRHWEAGAWRSVIGGVLIEMERVTAPGGTLIILETLGTGSLTPSPPTQELAEYFTWLEEFWRYRRTVVRTDYAFSSPSEAVRMMEFFFGPELTAKIHRYQWARVPEWTGVWVKSQKAARA